MSAPVEVEGLDAVLEQWMERANVGVGEVEPVPERRTSAYGFALTYKDVTEDLIRMFTVVNGDTNPLWRDPEYAAKSPWGGIVAPPMYVYCVSGRATMPAPPDVDCDLFFAGAKVEMYRPFRPGDRLTAEDVRNPVENKSKPGRPHRTLLVNGERRFYNQEGDLVAVHRSRHVLTATLPGAEPQFANIDVERPLRPYSDEELKEVYDHYDAELAGELRRGAEPRFWEDVHPGDELGVVIKGPLDILDLAGYVGVAGSALANASKWEILRPAPHRQRRDPATRAYHYSMTWHLHDGLAQMGGMPRAMNFGALMNMNATHLVNNWLGDHGWVHEFETRITAPMLIGEILRLTGEVVRTYEEDGRGVAELALRGVERNGIELLRGRAIVQLPHRGNPDEVVRQVLSGAGALT